MITVIKMKDVNNKDLNGVIDAIRKDPKASAAFTAFERACREYMQQVHDECVEGLTPEETDWFERWWRSEKIDWDKVPKRAHDSILEACSRGCG
jgi:hypothetical protein